MRILALSNDPLVVRQILEHLALWHPEAMERSPPVAPEAWPLDSVPPMTYHPVPVIATRVRHIQPECCLLWPLRVADVVNRAVLGANYPRTRHCELAVRLMSAATTGCARKERD